MLRVCPSLLEGRAESILSVIQLPPSQPHIPGGERYSTFMSKLPKFTMAQSLPKSEHSACLAISLFYPCPKGETTASHVGCMPHSYPHVHARQSPWLHSHMPKYHSDAPGDTLSPVLPTKPGSQFSHRHARNSVSWTFGPVSSGPRLTLLLPQNP